MTDHPSPPSVVDPSRIDDIHDMPLPTCRMAPDTTVLEANKEYCQLVETPCSELVGKRVIDLIPPENADHLRWIISQMTPANPSHTTESQVLYASRTSRWLVWNDIGVFDSSGTLEYIWGFCWDVTDERRKSRAMEDLIRLTNDHGASSEDILSGILQIGSRYFHTPHAAIQRLGPGGCTTTHALGDEGIFKAGELLAVEESYTSLPVAIREVVAIDDLESSRHSNSAFRRRAPLRRVICSPLFVEDRHHGVIVYGDLATSSRPFTSEDIHFCRLLVQWASFTISRQIRVEALSRNERIYRRVFNLSPIMMHTIDKNGILTDVNRAWLEGLGYARGEVIGHNVTEFMTEASATVARTAIRLTFNEHQSGLPRSFRHKDGSIVETEVATMDARTMAGDEALAVLADVTDRNRAQRSLTRGNDEMRRANEGLKRFNAMAAHDLQEPLRKIGIFGSMLKETLIHSDNTDVLESLAVVVRSSERLSKLVRDLLAYSRQTECDYGRERVELGALLEDVLGDLELMITENNAVVSVDSLPVLVGDPVPVERLFHNLLNNALTYKRLGYPAEVRIFARPAGNGAWEIIVRDNGIGVPEDATEKIFEPFARLQPTAFSGTGIGLAMCKSIAEGHGWKIRAQSRKEARGSEFILTIPAPGIAEPPAGSGTADPWDT